MVIWLVGLSGAGKTTIGRRLYHSMKTMHQHTVFIDGDEIRSIFRHDKGDNAYSLEGRKLNAERIQAMCAWLESQEINVVCCILSVFSEITQQNRQKFKQYFEVFVDTPLPLLIEQDNKGLYKSALKGEINNVVGVDIEYNPPCAPDLIIKNSMQKTDLSNYVASIINALKETYDYK
ncbi:adenylyl-sulfate kinase [Alteromonas ponticola]|uniref:Adenylyl-sulfate kinase n=1 Tax=Alteromonas ponticola TaxID=2720613 RepID=A0ABX1R350_9ALTE|nr:adenylyl-sulfate kinase [Alteromonas ponticola]NMH59635.1 adenylyl-sulfate kinase [Alteromonas ponticola]